MKTKKSAIFALSILVSVGATAAPAPETILTCTSQGGHVEFVAVGRPSLLKIHGKSAGPECRIQIADGRATGELTLDLDALDTGIETRTHHMKEKYLETGRYQKARLVLDPLALGAGVLPTTFTGTLELHGVKKPIQGSLSINEKSPNEIRGAQADFELKLTDYGITIPQFAGITVSDQVNVHVALDQLQSAK